VGGRAYIRAYIKRKRGREREKRVRERGREKRDGMREFAHLLVRA
jgi:hypothetical protein